MPIKTSNLFKLITREDSTNVHKIFRRIMSDKLYLSILLFICRWKYVFIK